ncbi:Hypothetical Protein RradSPS_1792 [Rubrobacter radiotolerans]|uniref:Uncharacterized protein n=1 Tax=Rubrobacter radiotolerans TaxID=42256 RepID=A0A023X526_RUBRA|nr:hypothetical protein [Rubrobacter radiotolerans]AHY47075.1 Hypothetical Protein RradSPS_1792 [Rubrobacter radiotolerans]MDX5894481.1 hypothetical protein [Rubrobacter radiotolerans]SMC06095.1 conserved hypothetical protein [Rubrobacter radiotolerans DSM 5868]
MSKQQGNSYNNQNDHNDHHAVDAKGPPVAFTQVMAAGLASVGAAFVTSRFGVAGTLVGAGLTTMLITGGSAILKSYLDTLSGHVKNAPNRIRAGRSRANRQRAERGASVTTAVQRDLDEREGGMAVYGRRRREGFFSKLGNAFGWFRGLPSRRKRSILLGAAVPAMMAFVVALVAITGVELVGGRSLSCLTGGYCQTAEANGAAPSTTFGEIATGISGSAGGTDQPVDSQVESPGLAPEQAPSQDPSQDPSQVPSDGGVAVPDGSSATPDGSGTPQAVPEAPANGGQQSQPSAVPEEAPSSGEQAVPVQ